MTYRELLADIIIHADLDAEAYVVEWTRDKYNIVDPHKIHYPISRFSILSDEIIIETNNKHHGI